MLSIQIILASLFVLAILSLVAGVNNDAVNFLNPAIGSKATSIKILFVLYQSEIKDRLNLVNSFF